MINPGGWIYVDEMLPERFVPVLVYMPSEMPLPVVHEGYLTDDGTWVANGYMRYPGEVVMWRPMPEVLREE